MLAHAACASGLPTCAHSSMHHVVARTSTCVVLLASGDGRVGLPLLPSLTQLIEATYPGTQLAITEYNYGGVGQVASGLAVVAYNYAAAAEYIRDGKNGLLAPFDKTQEFINLAVRLAANAPRRAALGAAARATAEKIDWEVVHDIFEAALRDVISGRAHDIENRLSA